MFNFMPTANVNPDTGIRYGVISGHSLDQDVLNELHDKADSVIFDYYRFEEMKRFANEHDFEYDKETTADSLFDTLMDKFGDDFDSFIYAVDENFESGEQSAEFEYEGTGVVFSWLGGAPLIFITESKVTNTANLCSPCVPNAGNLDSKDPDGYECYDAPANWYPAQDD